ncbi:MAG: branched-chain amino acid transaminase [Gemmatimonadetes bacterium]|nr:branched-chain amino acid transaminase [Gemmatimonadota bacterium]
MSAQITEADWIWKDGDFILWREARVHLLSLAVQFGSSIFEGIRCYSTPKGPAIFRLHDHLRRLYDSCRIYRMLPPQSMDEIAEACAATVAKNRLEECYIRPMVLRGYGSAGLNPVASPIETYIPCWPWGTYLGEGALEQGVDACVSSWQRPEPNTFPAMSKAAGHYNNAQLIKMEALANGYVEAIAVGPGGLVSEGSGQNLFLVREGWLITPSLDGTQLAGITRDSIVKIAGDLGIAVREQIVPREMLYIADELFFTGTAAEVTPVRSVDRITIGPGRAGPITLALQTRFLEIVHGRAGEEYGWLAYVNELAAQPDRAAARARA